MFLFFLQMPYAYIPFELRAPEHQLYRDDRLNQRHLGQRAMFMVRQDILDRLTQYIGRDRHDIVTADIEKLSAMDDHDFFKEINAETRLYKCFPDPATNRW